MGEGYGVEVRVEVCVGVSTVCEGGVLCGGGGGGLCGGGGGRLCGGGAEVCVVVCTVCGGEVCVEVSTVCEGR